ncbi:hypothetical protein WJX73_006239 [Symbiochloris irregularis]|uniref:Uncharacterized protein n=1 Tax=Symbiochloris irregularis TaxID=706552 RepID=A0AAW1NXV0_9CHLO
MRPSASCYKPVSEAQQQIACDATSVKGKAQRLERPRPISDHLPHGHLLNDLRWPDVELCFEIHKPQRLESTSQGYAGNLYSGATPCKFRYLCLAEAPLVAMHRLEPCPTAHYSSHGADSSNRSLAGCQMKATWSRGEAACSCQTHPAHSLPVFRRICELPAPPPDAAGLLMAMSLSTLHFKDALAICSSALATPCKSLFPCRAEAPPLQIWLLLCHGVNARAPQRLQLQQMKLVKLKVWRCFGRSWDRCWSLLLVAPNFRAYQLAGARSQSSALASHPGFSQVHAAQPVGDNDAAGYDHLQAAVCMSLRHSSRLRAMQRASKARRRDLKYHDPSAVIRLVDTC